MILVSNERSLWVLFRFVQKRCIFKDKNIFSRYSPPLPEGGGHMKKNQNKFAHDFIVLKWWPIWEQHTIKIWCNSAQQKKSYNPKTSILPPPGWGVRSRKYFSRPRQSCKKNFFTAKMSATNMWKGIKYLATINKTIKICGRKMLGGGWFSPPPLRGSRVKRQGDGHLY